MEEITHKDTTLEKNEMVLPLGVTPNVSKPIEDINKPINISDEGLTELSDENFTREDMLLYIFCFLLLTFIGSFFWITQRQLETTLLTTQEINSNLSSIKDDSYRGYLETQMMLSKRRYDQGARVLLSSSTRKNTGFMVGTLLAFMGCIIVIRRVRRMPITADFAASDKAKFKVITSSPGIFITILGTIIILSTVLRYDSWEIEDGTIMPPASAAANSSPNPTIDPAKREKILDDLGNNSNKEK